MDSLPEELQLEIFRYLSSDDIIALTSICSSFNRSISNSLLVRKLEVKFRKLNGDKDSFGCRQYERLRVGFLKPQVHFVILERIGNGLKDIHFRNCKLKLESVRSSLVFCKNVSVLTFDHLQLSDVPNVLKHPLPNLVKLKLTAIDSDPRVFRALRNCSATELTIIGREALSHDFKEVVQFLLQQDCLRKLHFERFFRTKLFNDNSLDLVNFRLESFSLLHCGFQRTDHVKRFLECHADNLESLTLVDVENCEFSCVVNQMTRLKKLSIGKISLNYLEPLRSVEELELVSRLTSEAAFENLASVKHLTIKYIRHKCTLAVISDNIKQLESLSLERSSADGLNIRKVRVLTLTEVDPSTIEKLLEVEIEELKLKNCFVTQELIKRAQKSVRKLIIIEGCGDIKYKRYELETRGIMEYGM